MRYCTKCGNPLEDNAKFCTNCGAETLFTDDFNRNEKLEKKFPQLKGKHYFKTQIFESTSTSFRGTNQYDHNTCYLFLEDDKLVIVREGSFLKTNNDSRTILFSKISHINIIRKNLRYYHIYIYMDNGDHVIFLSKKSKLDNFKRIESVFNNYLNIQKSSENMDSSSDELLRFAELYEKGLLTKEEFDAAKKKLLGL